MPSRKSAVIEGEPQEETVDRLVNDHLRPRLHLVSLLQDLQEEFGYLPEPVLRRVAEKTGKTLVDVYGVATFYRMFRFKPRGRQLLSVCQGTACHVRGGAQVAAQLSQKLHVQPGETTADGEYTLETVNCLGCCAIGPVVVKEGRYHGQVTLKNLDGLIREERR
ncbi:MAG: NAD(P)H-dependent oxidoreductase subunit E [Elusimicrobia bacterium]|nr:NAD(P)H-dependent oxidoreductase subunit E [Elusimicrobiota bacterium]